MMKYGLKIFPEGYLDFLALGALNRRLDPGIVPYCQSRRLSDLPERGGI